MDSIDYEMLSELYRGAPPEVGRAFDFQRRLKSRIVPERSFGELKTVAGADISIVAQDGIVTLTGSAKDNAQRLRIIAEVNDGLVFLIEQGDPSMEVGDQEYLSANIEMSGEKNILNDVQWLTIRGEIV